MKLFNQKSSILLTMFFSLVFIALSVILSYVIGGLNSKQFITVLLSTFVVVFVSVYFSLRISRSKQQEVADEMIEKMRGVIELAEGRVVIDNQLLKFIEKEASKIWVVTKTLENDVLDENISESVLENLKASNKQYCYFIPDPDINPTVRRNKRTYEKIYNDYLDKVNFVYLPDHTLFMFDEIVIYNPDDKNFFGYTYMNLEGSGKRDQVVRIARENVEAIIDSLTNLIRPKRERQEKLIKLVMELEDNIPIKKEQVSFLIETIVSGNFSIEERKNFEAILRDSSINKKHIPKIQDVIDRIAIELKESA